MLLAQDMVDKLTKFSGSGSVAPDPRFADEIERLTDALDQSLSAIYQRMYLSFSLLAALATTGGMLIWQQHRASKEPGLLARMRRNQHQIGDGDDQAEGVGSEGAGNTVSSPSPVGSNVAAVDQVWRALESLNSVSRHLSARNFDEEALSVVLRELVRVVGLEIAVIQFQADISKVLGIAQTISIGAPALATLKIAAAAGYLQTNLVSQRDFAESGEDDESSIANWVLTIPIRTQIKALGVIAIEGRGQQQFPNWFLQLAEASCRHIAGTVATQLRIQEERRLALLEERTAIARELHDSLAQSLSFMKIQVSRLQIMIGRKMSTEDLLSVAGELREGLNGAHRRLRELLTTFRIEITEGGLGAALEEIMDECRRKSSTAIELDFTLRDGALSANQEFHLLQLVREATVNITKHAGARSATVKIGQRPDGVVMLQITDDGVGLGAPDDKQGHYGMIIMRERASLLGGELDIAPGAKQGTVVTLSFPGVASVFRER